MAVRGSRIKIFDKLWCLGALGDLDFCVSSTSFQKSNIGWPQQPPTEKVLRFNLIIHDSNKKLFFSKHQNKLNSWTWMTEVFSSDFWAFRNFCSLIDLISLCNLTGLHSLYSPISSKFFLIMMIGSSLAPKWPIRVPFCVRNNQKSNF